MPTYPVTYLQDPPLKRSRISVFFRWLLVIPHYIWLMFYGIGAGVVVFLAWFAIVFTGRWPAGMYEFVAGFVRFSGRLYAYTYLVCDTYPPFDGGEHPEYPVRVTVDPPLASYSRLKTFFRIILAIPVYIVQYVLSLWMFVLAVVIWFVGVFAGKTGPGLMELMRLPMAYYIRAGAYFMLVTETWPPFDPGPAGAPGSSPATA